MANEITRLLPFRQYELTLLTILSNMLSAAMPTHIKLLWARGSPYIQKYLIS